MYLPGWFPNAPDVSYTNKDREKAHGLLWTST